LDGLILRDDKLKEVWAGNGDNIKVAGVPLLTKLLFRRIGLQITHFDSLFLITGQYSASIKLNQYDPTPRRQAETSGGSAIGHQSDYVLQYGQRAQADYIYEVPNDKNSKIVGVKAYLEIKKSATDVSGEEIAVPIKKECRGSGNLGRPRII